MHAVAGRSTFRIENIKISGVRIIFGGSDVEKVHAAAVRSTIEMTSLKTPGVRTTFGCAKSQMSKECTRLRREIHFEMKILKILGVEPLIKIQMLFHFNI